MIVLKIIAFAFALMLVSHVVGCGILGIVGHRFENADDTVSKLTAGFVFFTLTGMIVFGLGGALSARVNYMVVMQAAVVSITALAGIIFAKKKGEPFCRLSFRKYIIDDSDKKILIYALTGLVFVMIVLQMTAVTCYRYDNVEAVRGLAVATKVYETGVLQSGSAMMNLWGAIAFTTGEHPLVLAYTIAPCAVILMYYLCYLKLISVMTRYRFKDMLIALAVVAALNIWGYQSDRLVGITLLMTWFSMGTFVVHGLLPMLLAFGKSGIQRHPKEQTDVDTTCDYECVDDEYQEEWDMKKHKIINARNLAIAWAVLAVMLVGGVFVLNSKINTLHESTANLQRDLDSRSCIYEFVTSGGESAGYLIKGRDGSLTMIGGGSVENADALYDFLGDYGYEITNWYLYEKTEEDVGAYLICTTQKGVTVENTYLLNRTEIKQ